MKYNRRESPVWYWEDTIPVHELGAQVATRVFSRMKVHDDDTILKEIHKVKLYHGNDPATHVSGTPDSFFFPTWEQFPANSISKTEPL